MNQVTGALELRGMNSLKKRARFDLGVDQLIPDCGQFVDESIQRDQIPLRFNFVHAFQITDCHRKVHVKIVRLLCKDRAKLKF